MRLILLTLLTMIAFAANSVLNRLALVDPETGPAAFAVIRLVSGAVVLAVLVWVRRRRDILNLPTGLNLIIGPLSLAIYVLGFSFAYVNLPAGVRALLLFGGVQVTMFAGAVVSREKVPFTRWLGAAMAFVGLVWLLWPGDAMGLPVAGWMLMALAAIGWGIYSLLGRGAQDALGATAVNFMLAVPLGLIIFIILPDHITGQGVVLAILSGGLTSGLGYALWYRILPQLGATRAAVAQLSVPVIAMGGGMAFLNEAASLRFVIASLLVLGGVVVSMRR
ncbi:DMT family transporter [Profundibacter amoris]|uniref:DMT family transporter n=1 Tax=Profundibacter amoris TaxID=2171755 RepID=A0A347UIW2_9RHOB|nr:DMT family transporter [Profundibacter amoris]AXX98790.1 DMT family transporter [Profundibacter amoris]